MLVGINVFLDVHTSPSAARRDSPVCPPLRQAVVRPPLRALATFCLIAGLTRWGSIAARLDGWTRLPARPYLPPFLPPTNKNGGGGKLGLKAEQGVARRHVA